MKSQQCMNCINLFEESGETLSCIAFPNGIPEEIITGQVDHSQPYPGDHGILYEAKDTRYE